MRVVVDSNSPQYSPALCQPLAGQMPRPPTGSVHLVGQGRPGYNTWKRITEAQSTRYGHRRRIARCGGRYTALAHQAQQ